MSTVGQIDGDSERRQLADARGWAERNGHTFVEKPLKDLGVSAYRGSNQREGAALGQFLTGLKEGKLEPGILYLEAVDRLSREPPMRILNLINDIFATGTAIYVRQMGQMITSENFQTLLFPSLSLMAALAHSESRQKSERITAANRARQERARTGKKAKGAYHPPWLTRSYEGGEVAHHVIPEVAASIRRIFDLAASGMGALSIARTLNAEGAALVPATHVRQEERRWFQSYVGRLLTDRRVLGEYQPSRVEGDRLVPVGDPVPSYFEAVITLEQWDAAQAAKDPKLGGKVGGRKGVFANLFTNGMARCAHCGGSMLMRAVYKKGSSAQMPYLRCAAANQGLKCENTKYARLDWFEAKLLAALPGIPWRDLIRNIPADDATQAVTAEIESVAQEIDKRSKASARLLRIIETTDEPDDEIITRRRELVADIANLKKRRDQLIRDRNVLRRNAQIDDGAVDQAMELARMMAEANQTELFVIRQKLHAVLKTVIEAIEVDTVHLSGTGEAMVRIRGGMILTVSLDKTTPVRAGIYMGGQPAFARQVERDGIPPLTPSEDGTKLVVSTR